MHIIRTQLPTNANDGSTRFLSDPSTRIFGPTNGARPIASPIHTAWASKQHTVSTLGCVMPFGRIFHTTSLLAQLVTAQGSTWRNGAVTIFRDRREPEEITTMVSPALFWVFDWNAQNAINIPLRFTVKRTSMAWPAYFARVGYKGTGLSPPISGGEEIVFAKDSGEVKHPLTNQVLPPQGPNRYGDRVGAWSGSSLTIGRLDAFP